MTYLNTKNIFMRLILAVCLFVCSINHCFAQYGRFEEIQGIKGSLEANFTVGLNNFLGDLGGSPGKGGMIKDYTLLSLRPLVGISLSYNLGFAFAVKGGINYTSVFGADSLIKSTNEQERWRIYRNANFRSRILEGYLGIDIYPLLIGSQKYEIKQIAPFIGIGVGFFHFNPQTYFDNNWIYVQPLNLEGQGFAEYPDRKPYSLTQIYVPVNIGLKYYLSNKLAITSGLMMRHTNTDYIDDNSTTYIDPTLFDKYLPSDKASLAKVLYSRSIKPEKVKPGVEKANSKNNDTYVTLFFSLSLRLTGNARW